MALGAGIRKEEEYLITWPRVNFDRKKIVIPKTKYGPAREVHMIKDVEHALRELRKMPLPRRRRYKDTPNPHRANCVFNIRDSKKWFASALKRARIENFRWHDLRHTFCSRLAQKGFNIKLIQEAAGHETITMAARYAHLDKINLAAAMETLNREPTGLGA